VPDISAHIKAQEQYWLHHLDGLRELQSARANNKIQAYFLEKGPYRRELYPKHIKFFAAGGQHTPMPECPPGCDGSPHRERCALAANRIGKTKAAAFEVTLHATGQYPDWWPGWRFTTPITCWAVNDSSYNVRDVNQLELLGEWGRFGTGMIPHRYIVGEPPRRSGIPQAVESITVRHISGGDSKIIFKSYEQGWAAFTGRAIDLIWCDEEPPEEVYAECCIRTMTTRGHILLTFTPLQGTTTVVKSFMDAYKEQVDA
jgi:phage terminase large subunit-like protein